jgi:hypothetical protein
MDIIATYMCAYCLQVNEVDVDGSAGQVQEYIEECQVCCRPNNLRILVSADLRSADVQAEPS